MHSGASAGRYPLEAGGRDSDSTRPADIESTRAYRYKYGFGLNVEQELARNLGAFARLGWSDGKTEAWVFTDVDYTASLGVSLKGESWGRPGDTVGIAGVLNGLSEVHREYLAAGGTGILAGDGALTYGLEEILEVGGMKPPTFANHANHQSRSSCLLPRPCSLS